MSTAITHPEIDSAAGERMERIESEIAELRHTMTELAQIVVGDIRDRREAALNDSEVVTPLPIPASIVPGGQTTVTAVNAVRRSWMVVEVLRELGGMVRMYFHPRYRVRRTTQMTMFAIFALIGLNYLFFNHLFVYVPIVTEVVERLIDVVLIVLLYKSLSRELARYRLVVAQLKFGPATAPLVPASLWNNDPDEAALTLQGSP